MCEFYDKDKIKDSTCNIVITRYGYGKTLYELKKAYKEIEKLHSIIKEVREYIENCGCDDKAIDHIEEILDKVEE